MAERDFEKEMKLSAREWKELHEGITFMTDFARENPRGIKDLIDKTRERAKSDVARGVLGDVSAGIPGLFSPLSNELTNLKNKFTGELGLNVAITRVENSVTGFIGSLTSLIGSVVDLFFFNETSEQNLNNIKDWMLLFNPLSYDMLLKQIVDIFIGGGHGKPSDNLPIQPKLLVTESGKQFDFGGS